MGIDQCGYMGPCVPMGCSVLNKECGARNALTFSEKNNSCENLKTMVARRSCHYDTKAAGTRVPMPATEKPIHSFFFSSFFFSCDLHAPRTLGLSTHGPQGYKRY